MKRNITRILVILSIILNISFLCSCVPSVTKVKTKMNKANYKGLCSIGRTKTKSGRAETDKSKLNRKRVIELPEKVPAKCFKTV